MSLTHQAHDRWVRRPHQASAEPGPEQCGACRWWLPLSGEIGADWGVCASASSTFDGMACNEHGGCKQFERNASGWKLPFERPGTEPQVSGVRLFVLWHVQHGTDVHRDSDGHLHLDQQEDGDEVTELGMFSTRVRAEAWREEARLLPGYVDEPSCFQISEAVVDRREWTEGFSS